MKRGELWTLQDYNYASKARPVIIIQDDLAEFDSIVLCLLTTYQSESVETRVKIKSNKENGLLKDSFVMTEKLLTVSKSELGKFVGRLTEEQMRLVSQKLAKVLRITREDIES